MSFSEELGVFYIHGDPGDMRARLSKVCGAFFSYKHFTEQLLVMGDDFDDPIEDYDPVTWLIGLSMYTGHETPGKRTDPLIDDAVSTLRLAGDAFMELERAALMRCKQALKETIIMDANLQIATIGFAVERDDNKDAFIDYLFLVIDDTLEKLYESSEFEVTYEPLSEICDNDGMAIILQLLYDIKDNELPTEKKTSNTENMQHFDIAGQMVRDKGGNAVQFAIETTV